MPVDKQQIAAEFGKHFDGTPCGVVRAPGRVNLIGEHTDYNDGFVMPLAIDRAIWLAIRPREDGRVVVHSLDYNETQEFSLDSLLDDQGQPANDGDGWIEYIKGTAWALQDAGLALTGWEGVMKGDVPLGAGLSSSAALEMATARAFAAVGNLDWDAATMAKLGQRAENVWVGVNCGIMDQLISAAGQKDHALLIDCRSLDMQLVPFPPGVAVVILDTATRRGLVDSAYNERRSQCEEAAEFFGVDALRDVSKGEFDNRDDGLDEVTTRRAKHVITENERTEAAGEAMKAGEAVRLGQLMGESHVSLRDDYEVSSDGLNAIVESAAAHAACIGTRMTGAGFGGCAVAIIQAEAADDFVETVAADYAKKTGNQPTLYVCQATNGAEFFNGQ